MEKRYVFFRLGDVDGFNPNLSPEEQKEQEEREKERKGIFHCWASCFEHNPQNDQMVQCKCAIIEDKDGKLHEVPVRNIIKFCEPLLK